MKKVTFPTSPDMAGIWAVMAETGRGQLGDLMWIVRLNKNGSPSRQARYSKNISRDSLKTNGVPHHE